MKLNLHNKIEILVDDKKYCFYNSMLSSVKDALIKKKSYNDYLAFGTGNIKDLESFSRFDGQESLGDNFKLSSHLKSYKTEVEFLQNDAMTGRELYVKKSAVISDSFLVGKYLTEAGITNCAENNPTIYNYFSLISDEFPRGIFVENTSPILISVYVYLDLASLGSGLFTGGENKFINFLLGLGLDGEIYACRGMNLADNLSPILRENLSSEKYLCELISEFQEDGLLLSFSANLGAGETAEIVLLVGDSPFARLNVLEEKSQVKETENFTPKRNYVIDVGENVKEIESVTNLTQNLPETNIFVSKYAKRFADKISLPFGNLFSSETPRFLSKDGKMIFFVMGDKIYGYRNENLKVNPLLTGGINISNITNIVAFDDFMFVFSRSAPYIFCYKIIGETFTFCEIDINSFEENMLLSSPYKIDITLSKNGNFLFAFIDSENHYGYTLYYTFDESQNKFIYDSYLKSGYDFNYILAMFKNNFTDACIMFVKEDESVYNTRLVYHYADKSFTDIYTTLAVYFTENTREIYTKNRAVIIEKTTEPYIWVYFYPQKYRYTLSLFGVEENDYISTNLHYLIQKMSNDDYKIYNLVGYDTPELFTDGIGSIVNQSKILDFEFLDDTLLIFMDDEKEPIVAFNFYENCMLIENVSSNEDLYSVAHTKYDLIGKNNEGVIVKFTIKINL